MERSFVREDDELGVSSQPGGALRTLRESHQQVAGHRVWIPEKWSGLEDHLPQAAAFNGGAASVRTVNPLHPSNQLSLPWAELQLGAHLSPQLLLSWELCSLFFSPELFFMQTQWKIFFFFAELL